MVTRCSSIIPTWKARMRGQRQSVLIGDCQDQAFPENPSRPQLTSPLSGPRVAILSCKEGWERSEVAASTCCSGWNSPIKCFPSLRTISDTLCQIGIPAAQLCLPLPPWADPGTLNVSFSPGDCTGCISQEGCFPPVFPACPTPRLPVVNATC